jgi:adenylylsulfate kinase
MRENIFPIYDQMIPKSEKESKYNHKSKVIWMTGLSGSGKSTIGKGLEKMLFDEGYKTALLDGDNIRDGLNKNLGFDEKSREENIRRIAEVSKLFNTNGILTICCFVSPTEDLRASAREIIGQDFIEVYISTSLKACEERDVKGLYKKARAEEIKDFTGITAPFDIPQNPEIIINTEGRTIEESIEELFLHVKLITRLCL